MSVKTRRFYGLHGPAKAWTIAKLHQELPKLLIVCRDSKEAESLYSDLELFISDSRLVLLPAWDTLPFENVSPQSVVSAQRIHTLSTIANEPRFLCVLATDALMQRTVNKNFIDRLTFSLQRSQTVDMSLVETQLKSAGYSPVSLVEEVGEMAVRGAVIDLFSPGYQSPFRLEFSGSTLLQIKSFESESQRSSIELDQVKILPVIECPLLTKESCPSNQVDAMTARIKSRAQELEVPLREISKALEIMFSGTHFPGLELLSVVAQGNLCSVLDYLCDGSALVINDELGIHQIADSYWETIVDREKRLAAEHYLIPKKEEMFFVPDELIKSISSKNCYYLDSLQVSIPESVDATESLNVRSLSNIELKTRLKTRVGSGQALAPLAAYIKRLRSADYHVAFVVGSTSRAERLQRILLDLEMDARIWKAEPNEWLRSNNSQALVILHGHLSSGVQLPNEKLAFVAEQEIFSEKSHRRATKPKLSLKRLLGSLAQLKENDFVVHVDYGVGAYKGLKHMEVQGIGIDLLQIDYADSRLYLPVYNINKIQKFVGTEDKPPTLDKLSSNRWLKTKQKVQEAVVTLAGDLIKLYAARSVARGWRFEPAGAEDERFGDDFAYDETPDQLKAIEETLQDMAKDKPMDRLVCGDVGFGKTEIAIRASFKCMQHARQVAVLVPTTILVDQHYENFKSRFADYPFKLGAVSRFYSAKQNKATLERLANGELDLIIGTHRLLSRDVIFKDLGLVIIDEEHRFGVKQKERLKQLKTHVDVLTLTATPIPRTLHMSLLGIRDISLINSPPVDRRVIRTYVAAYDDSLIKDAVRRELQRGGQCFYVHNRVESIEGVTATLQTLVPEARIGFGHGQMSEDQLEKVMHQYIKKEIDILVCTTIIESGLDIPNANTIIIERADAYGLAQLYQLRGRVGRSDRQAYAYLMIPRTRAMSAEAQKRLKVLQSLDDLGLGFNLAIRDLEIRGAGNLLGKEQSGTVEAVGFELYTKILKEALTNLKGEELALEEIVDPEVKIPVEAFIPEHYIPDISERLVLYQRLASISTQDEAYDLLGEIEDRFGPPPTEVESLVKLMRFRGSLKKYGVLRAELSSAKLTIAFSPRAPVDTQKIVKLVQSNPAKFKFSKNHVLNVGYDHGTLEPERLYDEVERVIEQILRSESVPSATGSTELHG